MSLILSRIQRARNSITESTLLSFMTSSPWSLQGNSEMQKLMCVAQILVYVVGKAEDFRHEQQTQMSGQIKLFESLSYSLILSICLLLTPDG